MDQNVWKNISMKCENKIHVAEVQNPWYRVRHTFLKRDSLESFSTWRALLLAFNLYGGVLQRWRGAPETDEKIWLVRGTRGTMCVYS